MAKETFDRIKPHLGLVVPPPNNLLDFTLTSAADVLTVASVTFDGGDVADYIWLVNMTPPRGQGSTTAPRSAYKLICTMENVGLAGTMNLLPIVQERFGNIEVGAKVFVNIEMVDSVSGTKWNMGTLSTVVSV
jgi:hypothetical protein